MRYEIIANRFAPKRTDLVDGVYSASHSICFSKCNFSCPFCDFTQRPDENYKYYNLAEFENKVNELLRKGRSFKFTGGEPTLNPELFEHLKIVRKNGGYIYLDTNGSNPRVIKKLIDEKLVDVLGVSIKGITKEEASKIAGVKNVELVWDNVFQTIKKASEAKDVRTIVTCVFTYDNFEGRINKFAELMKTFPDVYLKINNLQGSWHPKELKLVKVPNDTLEYEVDSFIKMCPEWSGRVILINTEEAIENYSKIRFY